MKGDSDSGHLLFGDYYNNKKVSIDAHLAYIRECEDDDDPDNPCSIIPPPPITCRAVEAAPKEGLEP